MFDAFRGGDVDVLWNRDRQGADQAARTCYGEQGMRRPNKFGRTMFASAFRPLLNSSDS